MSLSRRYIPRCLNAVKRHHFSIPRSRPFSISVQRRANRLMETSGFSDTQLEVREAIAKICSNFPDVSYWHVMDDCWMTSFLGILGSPWWIRRISSWTARSVGERWLDWDCPSGGIRWSWVGDFGGDDDVAHNCRVRLIRSIKFGLGSEKLISLHRSGAGMTGAQSIHASKPFLHQSSLTCSDNIQTSTLRNQ